MTWDGKGYAGKADQVTGPATEIAALKGQVNDLKATVRTLKIDIRIASWLASISFGGWIGQLFFNILL